MSLPEISRRCLSCGAAVRAGARFCPHCGQPVNAEGASAGGAEVGRRALERAGAEAPATRDAEAPTASDGATPVTRDGAAPTTRDIEVPSASEPSASSATTRDAQAPARVHEATSGPSVVEGRAGVGATSAGPDAGDAISVGEALVADAGAAAESAAADASAADVERRSRVARVREVTRERVGRVREEALVALEETPDDAGLRFVVAAVALFLLAAFLLFLSLTVLR